MFVRNRKRLMLCASIVYLLVSVALLLRADARLTQQPAPSLSQQAYAILKQNCFGCHGAARTSELDLRTAEGVLAGGHNGNGFSVWLAGGGVKGGTIVGATDEYGYRAVENRKSIYELHATILHLLGLDHEKLTYRFSGRDMRLTDVHGRVIREVLL